ncbi:MAG: SDR family oxidoreductase [Kibdelosporangium sp.]
MRTVRSGDVALAVYEHGDPADPAVLLIHGYPDDHQMWDGVVARLASRFHVVTYDVRGAGASTRPREVSRYRLEYLAGDLLAVADAVSPVEPVHVVAHDWGSIQAWQAVTEPHTRIASYTSISGPSLDHIGHWTRSRMRRPTRRGLRQVVNQQLRSWYILAFHTPFLAALAWRLGVAKQLARSEGLPRVPSAADGIHGMKLYRANIFQRVGAPRERRTDVPVQVIVPTADRYVTAALTEDLARWVPNLWRRKVIGSHWVPALRPDVIARMVDEFVSHVGGEPVTKSLRRAAVGAPRKSFSDSLVVVTGAGSGIGRATALEFSSAGADVVVTDIDLTAAQATVDLIGPSATAYRLDVTDEPAVRRLADQVALEHGVPDVVVNNAGIGIAGAFMDTSAKDWQRVIDVNLLGVVHGCKAFAELMIEAGEGGQIVNVASAAAYVPSRVLSAYSATKSAVLMLSECLRAELAGQGIGVTAICPGIVDTPITRSTTYVGVASQEERRERAARSYRKRNFPPSRVATEIVAAAAKNRAVVPVTPEAKAGLLGSRFAPGVMRRLARIEVGK